MTLPQAIREMTIAYIKSALEEFSGNKTRAAEELDCSVRMIRMRCADTPELKRWRVKHNTRPSRRPK